MPAADDLAVVDFVCSRGSQGGHLPSKSTRPKRGTGHATAALVQKEALYYWMSDWPIKRKGLSLVGYSFSKSQ